MNESVPGGVSKPVTTGWPDQMLGRALARFPSVMLVDDSKVLADTLALFFQFDGFTAKAVYDGPAALAMAKETRPSLVFIDIGMPGMDGLEVARNMRLLPDSASMVLVALTGWEGETHKRSALDAGFNHYLVKPVKPDSLRHFISDFMLAEGT